MATRKNTKFNKNTGYKDFTFSIPKQNIEVYNKIIHSKENNVTGNMLESKIDIPKK